MEETHVGRSLKMKILIFVRIVKTKFIILGAAVLLLFYFKSIGAFLKKKRNLVAFCLKKFV